MANDIPLPQDIRSEIQTLDAMLANAQKAASDYRKEESVELEIYKLRVRRRSWLSKITGSDMDNIEAPERNAAFAHSNAAHQESIIKETTKRIETILHDHLIENDRKYRALHESALRLNRLENGATDYLSRIKSGMSELECAIENINWNTTVDSVDVDDEGTEVRDAVRAIRYVREDTKHFQQALQEYNSFIRKASGSPRNDNDEGDASAIGEGGDLVAAFNLKTFAEAEAELHSLRTKINYIKGRIEDDRTTTERRKTAYLERCRLLCTSRHIVKDTTGVAN